MTTTTFTILAAAILASVGLSAPARADCVREPRAVALSRNSHGAVEAYRCNADDLSMRVEFLHLSDIVAPLLLKGQSSRLLRKAFGEPKLVRNEIADVYGDLLTRFGATYDAAVLGPALKIGDKANAEPVSDRLDVKKVKTLQPPEERFFPAVTEIEALEKNSVPSSLSYCYSTTFACEAVSRFCRRTKGQDAHLKFWRPLTAQDVANYSGSVEKFNAKTLKTRPKAGKGELWSKSPPHFLEMAGFLAAETWPEDWVVLTGLFQRGQCGDIPGETPGSWNFAYSARNAYLDAILIENTSKRPASIDSLIGESVDGKALRRVSSSLPQGAKSGAIQQIAQTLDPGKKLLVPTRIVFVTTPVDREDFESYKSVMDKAPELFKAAKLETAGDPSRRLPKFDDYIYGPELAVTALMVNSKRLNLKWPAVASTVEVTNTAEVGSCPYLLSLDPDVDEWVLHGKILHEASSASKAGVESRAFEGLRTRFRLEEREPEIAHIENVSLLLKLDDASVLRLSPNRPVQDEELPLGRALEIDFEAPDDVRLRVVQSTLEIRGYYERYANLTLVRSDLEEERVCRRPASR